MQLFSKIIVLIAGLLLLCVSFSSAQEVNTLPDLPLGALATRVIFPNERMVQRDIYPECSLWIQTGGCAERLQYNPI